MYLGGDAPLAMSSLQARKVHVVEGITLSPRQAALLSLHSHSVVSKCYCNMCLSQAETAACLANKGMSGTAGQPGGSRMCGLQLWLVCWPLLVLAQVVEPLSEQACWPEVALPLRPAPLLPHSATTPLRLLSHTSDLVSKFSTSTAKTAYGKYCRLCCAQAHVVYKA